MGRCHGRWVSRVPHSCPEHSRALLHVCKQLQGSLLSLCLMCRWWPWRTQRSMWSWCLTSVCTPASRSRWRPLKVHTHSFSWAIIHRHHAFLSPDHRILVPNLDSSLELKTKRSKIPVTAQNTHTWKTWPQGCPNCTWPPLVTISPFSLWVGQMDGVNTLRCGTSPTMHFKGIIEGKLTEELGWGKCWMQLVQEALWLHWRLTEIFLKTVTRFIWGRMKNARL